jgi:hypothetical protein
MVERFGKDESNWEHVELEFTSDNDDSNAQTTLTNNETDSTVVEDEQMSLSSYEMERQKRIEQNRLALLQLVRSHYSPHPGLSLISDDSNHFFLTLAGVDI